MNSKPTETTLEISVSLDFIKAAVRDRLNTFKMINDAREELKEELEFGDVTLSDEGVEVVPIILKRTIYLQGGATQETNA